ncbi:MAG: hypothetical protein HZC48_13670 [Nitrospirae bacterium]|nr:hypothetical protein [Nitrospirota bacterium]
MSKGPFPIISVHDTYEILPDKSAKCTRVYTLYNKSSKTINIATAQFTDKFDAGTVNHAIEDTVAGNRPLGVLQDTYNKVCYWYPSKPELSPEEKIKITLSYDWPAFLPTGDTLQISNRSDKKIQYSLTIKGDDLNLINQMKINESTPANVKTEFTSGELRIGPVEISGGAPLFHAIISIIPTINIKFELPLLKFLASQEKNNLFSNHVLIMVQHLLGDFIPFINALEQCGLKKNNCYIIGIPYSTKDYVVSVLKEDKKYPHVFAPADYPFDNYVNDALKMVGERCKTEGKKFIIIEDGGYVVPLLHSKEFRQYIKHCIGAVEQTKNGIWVDRDLEKKRKLKLPVMSVADSKLKNEYEGKLIGQAVCGNIDRLLQKFAKESAYEKKCLVIGLGSVGLNVCAALKAKSAIVYGYDSDSSKRKEAKRTGIQIAKSIMEKIGEVSLIIGGTGKSPINFREIVKVRHNTVFVNATSKRKEINYQDLDGLTNSMDLKKGFGIRYRTTLGKDIWLLANGYPVNFFDAESVPDKDIQFVPALLFKAAALLFDKKYSEKSKVHNIPGKLQAEIKDKFLAIKDSAFDISQ